MDLVSSIRKSGSRGGVNFSWDDVATSQHRENYLGHSLKAPVGRWQQGRDLSWYAKGEAADGDGTETAEERAARERKEEIRRIKEAEEDALAKALGLPIAPRNATGASAISVPGERDAPVAEEAPSKSEPTRKERSERSTHRHRDERERKYHRRHRERSRSRDRDRARERSPRTRDHRDDRSSHRHRDDARSHRRRRSRSREDRDRRHGDGRRRDRDQEGDRSDHRREERRGRGDGGRDRDRE